MSNHTSMNAPDQFSGFVDSFVNCSLTNTKLDSKQQHSEQTSSYKEDECNGFEKLYKHFSSENIKKILSNTHSESYDSLDVTQFKEPFCASISVLIQNLITQHPETNTYESQRCVALYRNTPTEPYNISIDVSKEKEMDMMRSDIYYNYKVHDDTVKRLTTQIFANNHDDSFIVLCFGELKILPKIESKEFMQFIPLQQILRDTIVAENNIYKLRSYNHLTIPVKKEAVDLIKQIVLLLSPMVLSMIVK